MAGAGTSNQNVSENSVDSNNLVSKLRLAAKNDNSEKIKELLYKGEDKQALENVTGANYAKIKEQLNDADHADLRAALFQCVAENDPESVVVLLLYKYEERKKEDFRNSCITPTINLAAQLGHYEMIDEIAYFLIQNEYLSDLRPKNYDEEENENNNRQTGVADMLRSQIAISRYRVLSSPVYRSLM